MTTFAWIQSPSLDFRGLCISSISEKPDPGIYAVALQEVNGRARTYRYIQVGMAFLQPGLDREGRISRKMAEVEIIWQVFSRPFSIIQDILHIGWLW
jgi:hypothetical protein